MRKIQICFMHKQREVDSFCITHVRSFLLLDACTSSPAAILGIKYSVCGSYLDRNDPKKGLYAGFKSWGCPKWAWAGQGIKLTTHAQSRPLLNHYNSNYPKMTSRRSEIRAPKMPRFFVGKHSKCIWEGFRRPKQCNPWKNSYPPWRTGGTL